MKVIAVDDEKLALKDLTEVISEVLPEAEIQVFRSSETAKEYINENQVDIAFLDIEMKEMDGLQLAKILKEKQNNCNIIFVTGYSKYAMNAFSVCASDYILKPAAPRDIARAIERLRNPIVVESRGIRVQCFGNFEIFNQGIPVSFSRSKSKELLAYLVHKRGSGCTTRELCAVLFEDRAYSISLSRQMQVIISSMLKTLEKIGARDIIVKKYNSISIDISEIDCDYYKFLLWDMDAVNAYSGEYMSGYSWAEFVIGYLDSKVSES